MFALSLVCLAWFGCATLGNPVLGLCTYFHIPSSGVFKDFSCSIL